MGDQWPMIAGVGAGVAAAAAVGQMIVAAVSLGNQDATVAICKNLTQAFKMWLTSDRKEKSEISSAS